MNNSYQHQKLVDDLLIAFGSRIDVRCWPRIVAKGSPLHNDEITLQFGIVGETDIDGIVAPFGFRLAIEVKTGSGKLSKEQIRWRDMIIKFGGIYIEARSVEQALLDFEIQLTQRIQSLNTHARTIDGLIPGEARG